MTTNLISNVDSWEYNFAYLFHNGNKLYNSQLGTSSGSGEMYFTGGRVVTLEASAGDTIEIRTTMMDGSYYRISFCVEYIHTFDFLNIFQCYYFLAHV